MSTEQKNTTETLTDKERMKSGRKWADVFSDTISPSGKLRVPIEQQGRDGPKKLGQCGTVYNH